MKDFDEKYLKWTYFKQIFGKESSKVKRKTRSKMTGMKLTRQQINELDVKSKP